VFGLPAARLRVVAGLPLPWLADGEEAQDAEIVHAVAPAGAIRVVLIGDSALASARTLIPALAAALRIAVSQGTVISLSSGWAVLAVGGTRLTAHHAAGTYVSKTVWNDPAAQSDDIHSYASGGGFSHLFARPGYQDGVPGIGVARGVPDVAAEASPGTGMALAVSDGGRKYIIGGASGTSAGAPFWAALIALANQDAGHDLGFVDPSLYQIGRSAAYHHAFHDITTGTNTFAFPPLAPITGYRAAPGWDPVTGWGTPDAQVLVPCSPATQAPDQSCHRRCAICA
jgi:subtilase family serine protease